MSAIADLGITTIGRKRISIRRIVLIGEADLTRPFDKHLDSDELDGLVSSHAASVTDSGRLSEETLGEAQRHVESCQDCSRKVQMHKSVQSEILNMGVPSNAPVGPDCVEETEWQVACYRKRGRES